MLRGTYEPGFEPLAEALEKILAAPPHGGAGVTVYQHGRPVFEMWGGPKNPDGEPWERTTPSVSYSTSKGVIATALHMCRDRGLIRYDDPVAKYWPEFAQNGKGGITVRQALSHGAGLYAARTILAQADQLLDWDATVEALAAAPAAHAPGRHHAYHAITYGHLIGELVRRVSGKPVPRFVREEIAEPLGLRAFFLGAPDDAIAQAARNMVIAPGRTTGESPAHSKARQEQKAARMRLLGRVLSVVGVPLDPERTNRAFTIKGISKLDFSSPTVLRACIPAANGLFAAPDLARFYAVLAGGGAIDGVRLLSESTLREATTIHARGPDGVLVAPMRWRLGYHGVLGYRGFVRGAFGHYGYNGSGAWASPRHRASLAYVVNAGMGTPVGDVRMIKLTSAAMIGLKARMRRAA
ncbi:MAG: serine hydrolase domain-containing protein [Polyangiales bacterium]